MERENGSVTHTPPLCFHVRYAYHLHLHYHESFVLPLINIPKNVAKLRPDAQMVFEQAGIDPINDLIYIDTYAELLEGAFKAGVVELYLVRKEIENVVDE